MVMGKVVGHIVSTKKQDTLIGYKILEVRLIENQQETEKYMVAVDTVGAGIGEMVLVATGSAARIGCNVETSPVDAAIVGIIDDAIGLE